MRLFQQNYFLEQQINLFAANLLFLVHAELYYLTSKIICFRLSKFILFMPCKSCEHVSSSRDACPLGFGGARHYKYSKFLPSPLLAPLSPNDPETNFFGFYGSKQIEISILYEKRQN